MTKFQIRFDCVLRAQMQRYTHTHTPSVGNGESESGRKSAGEIERNRKISHLCCVPHTHIYWIWVCVCAAAFHVLSSHFT